MTPHRCVPDQPLHDSVASLLEAQWLLREIYRSAPSEPGTGGLAPGGPAAGIRQARSELSGLLARVQSARREPADAETTATFLQELEGRLHGVLRALPGG